MFERHRFCKNPDCMKTFDPVCPSADCCTEQCRMRKNYLRRLAIKFLGKNSSNRLILNYMIVKCLLDKRMLRPKLDYLKKMGMDFNAFAPAVAYTIGDVKSVYVLGNLGLGLIDSETAFIVVRPK